MNKRALLMILDGWGIGDQSIANAIYNGNTPNIDKLMHDYPSAQLKASGENVGLPDGQMGNSEVGHLNIGAGRIVHQDLVRINKAVEDNTISENQILKSAYSYAIQNKKNVHLIGLVSDGGVHSSEKHLYKLCDVAHKMGLRNVFIHALMDGRDTDPQGGLKYMENLEDHLKTSSGQIASICGRYFTMDRDNRWERVKKGYDLLTTGKGAVFSNSLEAIKKSYEKGITDEFIEPVVIVDDIGKPKVTIQNDDVVICFNFRTDRLREITTVLTQKGMPEYGMNTMPLYYVTMTRYDDTFENIHILFDKENVKETIGEVLASNNRKQLRIAETEKYAHVTFFFSGGREEKFEYEERVLIQSPKVATYDLQPEMSAYKLKDAVIEELEKKKFDFICLNFANGDMVGHTGVYDAILKAVAAVDECVGLVVDSAIENDYVIMIIADHGNADYAKNPDETPNTAHSLNPVPCILINSAYTEINNGVLADVAPTLLRILNLNIPSEMSGKILV